MSDQAWFKNAVIYELHIRAFHDSNNDGTGDFSGLIKKLDYLVDLGITAIWILPFYPSPLKDDGYDISDYEGVHPNYGTINDFKKFLHESHARGLKVITELVINHTSDQHEWFQKSRRSPENSYWRNFYVWSDTPQKYREARIIFKDFEPSNWSWDPVANAYYWHRFYSHQPDLNFDNPEVQKAIFKVLDYWMEMGVDGLRLDAIPYLFEREGTSCENLPETHEFLKKLRKHVDEKYPNRMLLAEANQWPEDAVGYFGSGDECHMCFHFPLMPRLFMSIKMEDRYSIIDILRQTPEINENCQWAVFLRNHDELTLEMVTDEERDYMYNVYASDPKAAINLGIRRRLAPLVSNDRRQIELLNGLLFSMPGSPVIYYGDELGMGDNIYLGDRNGVRTPFQWSPDRNGGFSKADPQSLYLPLIASAEYHYETLNVETAQKNPNSLLWWTKKLIAIRKSYPELSSGKIQFIESENSKVLSFLRSEERTLLIVANLSQSVQYVELNLDTYKGWSLFELFGLGELPIIGDRPYLLTLGPYAFYWFELRDKNPREIELPPFTKPINIGDLTEPLDVFISNVKWPIIEKKILAYLPTARWFLGKERGLAGCDIDDVVDIRSEDGSLLSRILILEVNYREGSSDRYLLPLSSCQGEKAEKLIVDSQAYLFSTYQTAESAGVFFDSLLNPAISQKLVRVILSNTTLAGTFGTLIGYTEKLISDPSLVEIEDLPPSQAVTSEQSNCSFFIGRKYHFKIYKKIESGINPEVLIGRHLRSHPLFNNTPQLVGTLSYEKGGKEQAIACLQNYVENEGDGWHVFLNQLTQLAEQAKATLNPEYKSTFPKGGFRESLTIGPPAQIAHLFGPTLNWANLLGNRTAEMHLALAEPGDDPHFVPESFTPFYQRSLYQSFRNTLIKSLGALRKFYPRLTDENKALADSLFSKETEIYNLYSVLKTARIDSHRIRVHGDLHLGQVLYTGKDFYVIDFEGEPRRSLGERSIKRTPIKDVADMIRSFEYLAFYFLKEKLLRSEDFKKVSSFINNWNWWVSSEYLKTYLERVSGTHLIPRDRELMHKMLQVYMLEKALYELNYEINSRPTWVDIPLHGILKILQDGEP
jgi:maltose alpha-D-glucosyltransferase/alpha-amylase